MTFLNKKSSGWSHWQGEHPKIKVSELVWFLSFGIIAIGTILLGFYLMKAPVSPTGPKSETKVSTTTKQAIASSTPLLSPTKARITCYRESGITASGLITRKGIVATSDRSIKMGTKIWLEGYGEMLIADRTASYIQKQFGLTFDIYNPDCDKSFGVKRLSYKIIN